MSTIHGLALAAALSMPLPQDPTGEVGQGHIYYDSIENGRLVGGRITVDPTNPLHAAVGPVTPLPGGSSTTIVSSGDPANRVDLVLVGDGYTSAELAAYANDADALVAAFFDETPLDGYSNYFNVHRVDVTSVESGVDNDPVQGVTKNTALDMGFWCGGTERLLCVDVGKALQQAGAAPDVDQVLALANSTKYGGAGYSSSDLGTLAADNSSAIEVAKHEFGHSFANLADEYTYGGSTTYSGSEPSERNLSLLDSTEMALQQKKWHRWLTTPGVGTYEGGGYSQFGIYRPTSNSKMRNLGRPFDPVNTERFIIKIYAKVDPIDDASAPGIYPSTATLFVDPVDPTTHTLDVQWFLNGAPVPGATGASFDASPLGLTTGTHTISVTVVDNTPLVKDEAKRAQSMTETRSWTIADGPVNYCTPGMTASGCQAVLSTTGTPSVSQPSGFVVTAGGVEGSKDGLYFYGFTGAQANFWGSSSSYQCVVPPTLRSPLMLGSGTPGGCDGTFARDFNAYWATAPAGKVPAAGSKVWMQLWFRDPMNTSNQTTSLSDAIEFDASF